MGKLKHILAFTAFFLSLQCLASLDDTTFHLKKINFFAGNFTDFYADNLGNIYCISPTNQIKKINLNGDSLAIFNDVKQYGKIYSIDATNPLKILLYYKDFSTVLILDRFLNLLSVVDLRQAQIFQARAVAQTYDGNIWVYDELNAKIVKLDYNGNILTASADFRLLFNDDNFLPVKIIDNNSQLFLYDPKFGWKIFDYYYGFKKNLPYTNWLNVQATDNILSGRDSTAFYTIQTSSLNLLKALPDISLSDVMKTQLLINNIFVLRKEGLTIYAFSK